MISRDLANRVTDKLFAAHNLIRTGNLELAAKAIEDTVKFLWKFAESEDEKHRREASE